MSARPVILLLTNNQGAPIAVRFANREAAENFEQRHAIQGDGLISLVSQAEAALQGALR